MLVALRKESVDRNYVNLNNGAGNAWSLSARRAWIEMRPPCRHLRTGGVALRKESVDRNLIGRALARLYSSSLSARRAWIEIIEDLLPSKTRRSLSARRAWIEICCACRAHYAC